MYIGVAQGYPQQAPVFLLAVDRHSKIMDYLKVFVSMMNKNY
jgi:hypothetical protein